MRSMAGLRRFGPLLLAIVGPQAILLAGFLAHARPTKTHTAALRLDADATTTWSATADRRKDDALANVTDRSNRE